MKHNLKCDDDDKSTGVNDRYSSKLQRRIMSLILRGTVILVILFLLSFPGQVNSQDNNIVFPVSEIEQVLKSGAFDITKLSTLKRPDMNSDESNYQAKKAELLLHDGRVMKVKWKSAPVRGEAFNNQPRYELAAYQFQKLFLDPENYVVPPTVILSLPVQQYRKLEPDAIPTFDFTNSVLCVVQYWLNNVSPDNIFSETRIESDSLYAHHFSNLNLFTYLIKHSDSNFGNVLISTDSLNPRVFAVDNGIAFGKDASNRGKKWQNLLVVRVPPNTIERLRQLTLEKLQMQLEVVAQFVNVNESLVQIDKTPNLAKAEGVREKDGIIQFGLIQNEINDVFSRIQKLLQMVDDGRIGTY